MPDADTSSEATWAPLKIALFRTLWLAILVSNIGDWMQTVGAQWLLVDSPHASLLVSLVQTADTIPFVLLALPGGVLADVFDRRRLLAFVLALQVVALASLAALTLAGRISPALLLTFTFLVGAAQALTTPAWQAMIPDMVPRPQVPAAAALGSINVNLARVIGPAIGGFLVAAVGAGLVFALNGLSVLLFCLAALLLRLPTGRNQDQPEQFLPALRAGERYVQHAPVVRRILARAALFLLPASALWALLPLIARHSLGLGAGGYGLLLGALGIGAIGGAFALPNLRRRATGTSLLFTASLAFAAALLAFVWVRNLYLALLILLATGFAWVAVLSSINASLQLFLPVWVRARGLATFQMVLFGGQGAGAFAWGILAQLTGLPLTFLCAAIVMAVTGIYAHFRPFIDTSQLDRSPAVYWPQPQLVLPRPERKQVLVTVSYTVRAQNHEPFRQAMELVRDSRMRTGATRWGLYQDADVPNRFLELFTLPSWDEHMRQHGGRLTGADRMFEERAESLADGPAETDHFVSSRAGT